MHPADCPAWEYDDHPDADRLLPGRCKNLLIELRTGAISPDRTVHDTRPVHGQMFENLTPPETPYYAGHYRGETLKCLKHYGVMVGSDRRVGVPPRNVAPDLETLSRDALKPGFVALDAAFALPNTRVPPEDKLYFLVVFASRVLVEFLRIHPYANGNGHMGRFLVWVIMARFGYWPRKWPLNESPPYHQLLSDYRDGKPLPLEEFVLRSIVG